MKLFTHIIIVVLVTTLVPCIALCGLRASVVRKLPLAAGRGPLSAVPRLLARPLVRPHQIPQRTFCGGYSKSWGDCIPCEVGCGLVGGLIGSACGMTAELAAHTAISSFKKETTDVIEGCPVPVSIRRGGWMLGGLVGSAVSGGPLGCLAYAGTLCIWKKGYRIFTR